MKKAGELLGSFFDQSLMRSAQAYSEFFSAWKRIVGDHLAAHSRIVELEKTVLVVEADHPGWIQLIQMNANQKAYTIVDEILAFDAIFFMIACFVAFLALKGKKRSPAKKILENISDGSFLLAISTMVVAITLVVYSMV